jgi:hypothetical protein
MLWQEAQVSESDGFLTFLRWVRVLLGLEELGYVRETLVGSLIVVNGARLPRTPEFRSQVPNSFLERPAEYRSRIFSVQLLSLLWVGEVAAFAALEEGGADLGLDGRGCKVDKGVAKETNILEEQGPAVPSVIVLFVCPFGFRVEDSIFGVIVEEIQEEISLGSGTINKFLCT